MSTSFTDLLAGQTVQQIFELLLTVYQTNGFPTQSWQPFGVERTRLMAIATVLQDVSGNYVPAITGGGFLDYAAARTDNTWISLLAAQLYSIDINPATFTVGDIELTLASGAGPYTIHDGDLIAVFAATGNRYICGGNGNKTLSSGTTPLTLHFTSEFPGAKYNDPSNSGTITLVTTLPGVTLTNVPSEFSTVSHAESGTGTVGPSAGGAVGDHQVTVRIDSSGAAGVATWSTSLDGAAFVSQGNASTTTISSPAITISLSGGSTLFVKDDVYSFTSPGSWITTQGSDVETNAALATRCRNRWSSLSPIPVNNFYELMVTSTPTVGSQVTQVVIQPDKTINDKVNIVIAGPAGALPGGTVTAVQNYVNKRVPGGVLPVVVSPTPLAITIVSTVTVLAAQHITANLAIISALDNYINGIGINGTIRYNAIIETVMNVPGVVDMTSPTINGNAANLALGSPTSFVIPGTITLTLSYTDQ